MEYIMRKAEVMEEEKKQTTQEYNMKNKRGLTSQIGGTA